jgi:hypothetical protein
MKPTMEKRHGLPETVEKLKTISSIRINGIGSAAGLRDSGAHQKGLFRDMTIYIPFATLSSITHCT